MAIIDARYKDLRKKGIFLKTKQNKTNKKKKTKQNKTKQKKTKNKNKTKQNKQTNKQTKTHSLINNQRCCLSTNDLLCVMDSYWP